MVEYDTPNINVMVMIKTANLMTIILQHCTHCNVIKNSGGAVCRWWSTTLRTSGNLAQSLHIPRMSINQNIALKSFCVFVVFKTCVSMVDTPNIR